MFKLKPALTMKLVKQGWITQPMYKGNKFIIINPDDEEESYTFTTNNQVVWFLRGFESGLSKSEVKNPDVADVLKTIDEARI
jgi:hypothetical protein